MSSATARDLPSTRAGGQDDVRNITSAGAVDREFVNISGPFGFPWVCLGCHWPPLARLWAPFRSLWLPLGHPKLPLAVLWAHLAGLWSRFGALWEPVGSLGPPWAPLGFPPSNLKLDVHRLRCLCIESSLLELVTVVTDVTEVVSSTAAQTPTSTRAGG